MGSIRRELPIKIVFHGGRPHKYQQHIKRVRVEGPEDNLPEEIVVDADEIGQGGVLTIDDIAWPEGCEVVDRRGIDPVISVQSLHKTMRGQRGGDDNDYDD